MTTASQIITRAAQSIGYLGRGPTEVLSAADANDGLTLFNAMLDSWSTENLLSYVVLQRSFTLAVNKYQYTIGGSGTPDINTTRPGDILVAFVQDTNNNKYMMDIVNREVFDQRSAAGNTNITSQIPDTLFYDPQYPNGVISIFPAPLLTYTVFYNSTQDQVDPATLGATISMPVGYEHAYVLNLAIEMMGGGWPCLLDEKQLSALVNNASRAKGNIKRRNIKEVIANFDPYIVSRSYATYNPYRDSSS